MSTVDRELSITYGSISVGGASEEFMLDSYWKDDIGVEEGRVEFDVVVAADSEDAFGTLCRALEANFRTPRKNLVVSQGGVLLLATDHDNASGGFNTSPTIQKIGEEPDSGRSRKYRISISYDIPADRATTKGFRDRSVLVEYSPSRVRTIRISGVVTGITGTASARARYVALIDAYASSVLSALSVTTSELAEEPRVEHDYDDKLVNFERVYRELIFGQGQDSPNDDAEIVEQKLAVSRREFSEERSEGGGSDTGTSSSEVLQLATFDLIYEAWLDSEQTTDLFGKAESLHSWLVGQFDSVFNQGDYALTEEKIEPDLVNNRFVVRMVAQGGIDGVDVVSRTLSVQDKVREGKELRGAWTGNPLSRYRYVGFTDAVRIVTETYRRIGSVSQQFAAVEAEKLAKSLTEPPYGDLVSGGGKWEVLDRDASVSPVTIGIQGQTLEFSDVTTIVELQYYKPVSSGPTSGTPNVDRSSPNSGTPGVSRPGLNSASRGALSKSGVISG